MPLYTIDECRDYRCQIERFKTSPTYIMELSHIII